MKPTNDDQPTRDQRDQPSKDSEIEAWLSASGEGHATQTVDPDTPTEQAHETRALAPGDRFRQYELVRELGHGGAGRVFLARDTRLGRRVAMKFLASSSKELDSRFLAEASATAQFAHENIVVIYEINEHEGVPFMVLEYLEGETLRAQIRASRTAPTRAIEQVVAITRALVHAHEFGIAHCDLKPENVIVTRSGALKVLDFGIAQLLADAAPAHTAGSALEAATLGPDTGGDTMAGTIGSTQTASPTKHKIRGTLHYMSPEQYGMDEVDHRTDLWSVGIMLFELLSGQHPLKGTRRNELVETLADLHREMPSLGAVVPNLPSGLVAVVDRCLRKRKADRFATAAELLEALEALLPGRRGRALEEGESPYPGMTAFQETDADRFFGRDRDVTRLRTQLRDHSLVAVVGPSGVGKSSFVRAGLVPALRSAGNALEVFIVRPGRSPLAALAEPLESATRTTADPRGASKAEELSDRLRREPGVLGKILRERARTTGAEILLFIDQFEELYTLVSSAEERAAFIACLSAVADDVASPLRVVVSLRSDLLDRVSEHPEFMDELTRGLVFLRPPDRNGLIDALQRPLLAAGYSFEDGIVDDMLGSLESTPGALPLLQFAAAQLWDKRDKARKLLTRAGYEAMGGIEGTLSSHADDVVMGLSVRAQRVVRSVFQRLVTPEGTRAIVDVNELRELATDQREIQSLIDLLVDARLLVVQTHGDAGSSVEIVHESLISGWPMLRRWLEENHEDAAYLDQLRNAAKQWQTKGRAQGLLWRGEAMREARHWYRRYAGELPPREQGYLDAVFALADRSRRLRRTAFYSATAFVVLLFIAGSVALVSIRNAERASRREALRAQRAEIEIAQRLRQIEAKEAARLAAERATEEANAEVAVGRDRLRAANAELQEALARAEAQRQAAQDLATVARKETTRAREAESTVTQLASDLAKEKQQLEVLLERERDRVTELEQQRVRINVADLERF